MRKSLYDLYKNVEDSYTASLYEAASNLYRNGMNTCIIKQTLIRKMVSDSATGMIDGVMLMELINHIDDENINEMVYEDYTPDYVGFDRWDWEYVSCTEDLSHGL